jgi:hypothetical protein
MNKIEDRRPAQPAEKMVAPRNHRKFQSLHLDKQIIRTLTGAELRLVGGGHCTNSKAALG